MEEVIQLFKVTAQVVGKIKVVAFLERNLKKIGKRGRRWQKTITVHFEKAKLAFDTLAEWLRRRTANAFPLWSVGSNPTGVGFFTYIFFFLHQPSNHVLFLKFNHLNE